MSDAYTNRATTRVENSIRDEANKAVTDSMAEIKALLTNIRA